MHYHIVGRTSSGELALRETRGHSESAPSLEKNYYKTKHEAKGALYRWRYHVIPGNDEIMNCTYHCAP